MHAHTHVCISQVIFGAPFDFSVMFLITKMGEWVINITMRKILKGVTLFTPMESTLH